MDSWRLDRSAKGYELCMWTHGVGSEMQGVMNCVGTHGVGIGLQRVINCVRTHGVGSGMKNIELEVRLCLLLMW